MYSLLRPLLFLGGPETGHRLALNALQLASGSRTLCALLARRYGARARPLPVTVMGLDFPNPVGLAAGLDKDAVAVDACAALGFGFIEVGTVTPRPQPGNPRPRMFRLVAERAIINRMGFNNAGLATVAGAIRRRRGGVLLGVNLGKNADTPVAAAINDYRAALEAVYEVADYAVLNVSSPNTPGCAPCSRAARWPSCCRRWVRSARSCSSATGAYCRWRSRFHRISTKRSVSTSLNLLLRYPVAALIATNTTLSRDGCAGHRHARQAGGLSGTPLRLRSTAVIKQFYRHLRGRVPIIGVGGVGDAGDAWEKLCAGADLVQIYTALVYHGPGLAVRIVNGLHARVAAAGHASLAEALAEARRE